MSYDFALWEIREPLEDAEAGRVYGELIETGRSDSIQASDKIGIVASELQTHWPPPPAGREDESPWSAPMDVSPSHLIVTIVPSRLWDIWPVLGQLAKEHELVMYDPQQQAVFLPPRLSKQRTRLRAKRKAASQPSPKDAKTKRAK
jgi:hypothetical protein